MCGVRGVVHNWLGSYLEHITQFVCTDNVKSNHEYILWSAARFHIPKFGVTYHSNVRSLLYLQKSNANMPYGFFYYVEYKTVVFIC